MNSRRDAEALTPSAPPAEPPQPARAVDDLPWWRDRVAVSLLVLGAALIAFRLGELDLWLDELATTWTLAADSAGEVFARVRGVGQQSTLYSLLVWGYTRLVGTSPLTIRLLSAVAGVGVLLLLYLLGRWHFGTRRSGHLVLALTGCNVVFLRYAQDGRPYMLAVLLTCLSMYALLRALAAPGWRWPAVHAAAIVGLGYTHFLFLCVPVAQVAFLVWRGQWRRAACRRWLASAAVIALGLAPLLPQVLSLWQRRQGLGFAPAFTWQTPWLIAAYFAGGLATLMALLLAHLVGQDRQPAEPPASGRHLDLLATWLLVPVAGCALMSWLAGVSFFIPRYLLCIAPALWLLVGGAMARLVESRRQGWWALAAIALAAFSMDLGPNLRQLGVLHDRTPTGWTAAASRLAAGYRQDELVLGAVEYVEAAQIGMQPLSPAVASFVAWPIEHVLPAGQRLNLRLVPHPITDANVAVVRDLLAQARAAGGVWLIGHPGACGQLAEELTSRPGLAPAADEQHHLIRLIHLRRTAP